MQTGLVGHLKEEEKLRDLGVDVRVILKMIVKKYRFIRNDCQGFNNLPYTIHLRQQYVVAPMDQEILIVFFYDVRCAVVMHFSAWSADY